MSNAIIEQLNVVNSGRGRKTGKETASVRRAVVRIISNTEEPITTNDVAKACKKKKTRVIAALRWLEQKGFVGKVGAQRTKETGAGRPSAVWDIVEDFKAIDRTRQRYVQEKRQYIKDVSAMSHYDRKTMVVTALDILSNLQTEDEVEAQDVMYTNGQGFIKADAKRGVIDARKESLTIKEVNYWIVRIFKYRKQLNMS